MIYAIQLALSSGMRRCSKQQLDGQISRQQMNFLQMIERASYRMETITGDILSLERIENMQSGVTERVNLNLLVQDLHTEFKPQADREAAAVHAERAARDVDRFAPIPVRFVKRSPI